MARRRARGEGQVNWNGTHNTYCAVLPLGNDPVTSKPRMRTRYASIKGKTPAAYRDAEARLAELKAEMTAEAEAEQYEADPENYTLWDCITDWHEWVTTTPKTGQRTADKYLGQCGKWVRPRIGDLPLVKVDVAVLSDLLEEIAPHLSADSIQDILGAVRRAIGYARRQRIIDRNEAEAVELPEAGVKPRDWDFLTQEQVGQVLESVKGTRMHALLMTGFHCGLRPGEIRALQWEDIDFEDQCLYVVRYLKGGVRSTSRREVPLSDDLASALRDHRESWGGHPWVFTHENGKQLNSDQLRWRCTVVFRDAGLGQLDVYCMRHTFASVMDDRKVPHQTIADLMGHKNVKTFETIYRHRLRPVRVETPGLMNNIWGSVA